MNELTQFIFLGCRSHCSLVVCVCLFFQVLMQVYLFTRVLIVLRLLCIGELYFKTKKLNLIG
jgi:hypothetical protein